MSEFEPGALAVATVRGVPNVRVFRYSTLAWVMSEPMSGMNFHRNQDVTDVRPLVVLDPKGNPEGLDEFHAEWFRAYAQRLRDGESGRISAQMLDFIADQIEAQTKPPKPAEPRGLGAVVEDASGKVFVRIPDGDDYDVWFDNQGDFFAWGSIDAVRVPSEGVTNA